MPENPGLSKSERKQARRKQRAAAEQAAGKALIELADLAVEEALTLVERVEAEGELALTTVMPTISAAEYCRKRINEAFGYAEWLDEVEVWVWNGHTSTRAALTEAGESGGVEIRLETRFR